jgi:hypothetical protein
MEVGWQGLEVLEAAQLTTPPQVLVLVYLDKVMLGALELQLAPQVEVVAVLGLLV